MPKVTKREVIMAIKASPKKEVAFYGQMVPKSRALMELEYKNDKYFELSKLCTGEVFVIGD